MPRKTVCGKINIQIRKDSPRSTCPADFRHSYGPEKTDMSLLTAITKNIDILQSRRNWKKKI